MSSQEASARALLLEMQNRLAAGPHVALGVPSHATAADIRGAFLQLTKQFHPARFGRMASDIQRLSNEVFLGLRAAHDLLAKPTTSAKPSGRTGSITANPATAPAPNPAKNATRPFGVPVPPTTPARPVEPTPANPARQTQPIKQPLGAGRQTQPLPTAPLRGTTPPASAPPPAQPAARPTPQPPPTMSVRGSASPGRQGTIRFPTPARSSGPTPGTQASTPAAPTATPAGRPGSSASGPALDPELALILQLMGMGQWDAAQAAIDALSSKNPQNKRYAALACYSRGRRAQLEGKIRDAQIELQQALQLDPDLDVAKTAVAELYARRK